MSLSKLFDISRRSLATYQRALMVTSHNISNANNPNYSRQIVTLGTEAPDFRANLVFGSGVKIENIVRVKNQLTENQIVSYNQDYSYYERQSGVLGQIETLFSEPSDLGLSNLIDGFFNSWDELAVNPTSVPLRTNVVQAAQKMSSKFQNLYEGLSTIKKDLKSEADSIIKSVNNLTQEIQVLNKQIYENTVVGNSANDLLDQRDAAIRELSGLVNVTVSYDKDNVANISIGGVFAVDRVQKVDFQLKEENGKLFMLTEDGNAKAAVNSGELFAVTDSYSNKIPKYQKNLDEIANAIFTKVNEIHSTGYSLNDPGAPDPAPGRNFFDNYGFGVFKINEEILDDPNNLAISADGTDGNNEIAIKLAELRNSKVLGDNTISESYSNFVSGIGHEKQLNDKNTESNALVLNQLEQQKASYSGVSIDEEMSNVIMYQRSYDAAAKLIRVADEMLETLITMV